MKRLSVVPIILVAACATSVPVGEFEPAWEPRGVVGEISIGQTWHRGLELLAVEDSGYLLLSDSRLAFAPFHYVRIARFMDVGISNGKPGQNMLDQLRFASRFPYGVPAPAMAALLQQAGQQSVDTLRISVSGR